VTDKPVILLTFANDFGRKIGYLRNLPEEMREIQTLLENAEKAGLCEVVLRPNVTARQLIDVLQEYRGRISIFHYAGHADSYRLLLESSSGEGAFADASSLAAVLGQQPGIQLVFLNACSTEPQVQDLVDAGVAAVVATTRSIQDKAAAEFSTRFYKALVTGATIGTAFAEADAAIRMEHGGQVRGVLMQEIDGQPVPEELADQWPWRLHVRPGAERTREWNLPEAANDPLYGLPPLPAMDFPPAPYRNLKVFRREDAPIFFGRSDEIRRLYQTIAGPHGNPVILYYGQSGVGKSSLLAAGLLPRLEQVQHVVYVRRDEALGLTGTLARALQDEASRSGLSVTQDATEEGSITNGETLRELWKQIEAQINQPLTVLLDQVEESKTRPRKDDPGELQTLVEATAAIFNTLALRPQGRFVLSFRKEFLAEFDKALTNADVPKAFDYLDRLEERGVVDAVRGPARAAHLNNFYNLTIADKLPERIATRLLDDPGSAVAPMLQILMDKMWTAARTGAREKQKNAPVFDHALYEEVERGGVALGDFLNEQFNILEGRQKDLVASGLAIDVLAYHTTEMGTAQERTREELEKEYAHRKEVLPELVDEFRTLYLLTDPGEDTEQANRSTRLAHDTLAPLVHQRFEASDAPGQRARRVLENRGVEWEGGKTGATLDDDDLVLVEAGRNGMRMTVDDENRMLVASHLEQQQRREEEARKEREHRQALEEKAQADSRARAQRRNALLASVIAAILLVLGGTAIYFAIDANQQATEAELARVEEGKARATADNARATADAARATAERGQENEATARGTAEDEKERAERAEAEAVAANEELSIANKQIEELVRGIRADQLSSTALQLTNGDPPLALLLGVEGLRAQNDFIREVPYTYFPIQYDFGSEEFITSTVVYTREFVRSTALGNTNVLLSRIGGIPLTNVLKNDTESDTRTPDKVTANALSPDGRWLVGGFESGDIWIWDLAAPEPEKSRIEIPAILPKSVSDLEFSDDGHWLAATTDGVARIWDMESDLLFGEHLIVDELESAIFTVNFSPNGKWLVTLSGKGNLQRYDLTLDDAVDSPIRLSEDDEYITSVSFSPDSRWLVATDEWSSDDARIWDMQALNPQSSMIILEGGEDRIKDSEFSQDSRWFATGSTDRNARLWRLEEGLSGAPTKTFSGHDDWVTVVAFTPDNQTLITGTDDGVIRLWGIEDTSNPLPIEIQRHDGGIRAIMFSPDGRWLGVGSNDGKTRLWPWNAGPIQSGVMDLTGNDGYSGSLTFSPDSRWLTKTGGIDKKVYLWDLYSKASTETVVEFVGHAESTTTVGFATENRWLVTFSNDNSIRLWDLLSSDPTTKSIQDNLYQGDREVSTFDETGHWIATQVSDGVREIKELESVSRDLGGEGVVFPVKREQLYLYWVSPSSILATTNDDGRVVVWEPSPEGVWNEVYSAESTAEPLQAVNVSPNGEWLLTISERGSPVQLWNMENTPSNDPGIDLLVEGYLSWGVFSPDARWLAALADRSFQIELFDLSIAGSGEIDRIVLMSTGPAIFEVAFSPDGRWFAAGLSSQTILLWDLGTIMTGVPPRELVGREPGTQSLAFSPDGKWLAAAASGTSYKGSVTVWDMTSLELNEPAFTLVPHGPANNIAFSPDGRWIAVNGSSDYIDLWDLSLENPSVFPGHFVDALSGDSYVTFSADGRWLMVNPFRSQAKIFPFYTADEMIDLACQRAGRNMTLNEWARYLGDQPYRPTCLQWPSALELEGQLQ